LLRLLAGTPEDRLWAARIAGRVDQPERLGLLIGLCQALEPGVRANAAAGLATLVAAGEGGGLAVAALRQCLADPGTEVPRGIAEALTAAPTLAPAAQDALAILHGHQSALVRRTSYRSPAP
jgi:HEAT repeat protein